MNFQEILSVIPIEAKIAIVVFVILLILGLFKCCMNDPQRIKKTKSEEKHTEKSCEINFHTQKIDFHTPDIQRYEKTGARPKNNSPIYENLRIYPNMDHGELNQNFLNYKDRSSFYYLTNIEKMKKSPTLEEVTFTFEHGLVNNRHSNLY